MNACENCTNSATSPRDYPCMDCNEINPAATSSKWVGVEGMKRSRRKPVCGFVTKGYVGGQYPIVVCDDGTVWQYTGSWSELPCIPGTEGDK